MDTDGILKKMAIRDVINPKSVFIGYVATKADSYAHIVIVDNCPNEQEGCFYLLERCDPVEAVRKRDEYWHKFATLRKNMRRQKIGKRQSVLLEKAMRGHLTDGWTTGIRFSEIALALSRGWIEQVPCRNDEYRATDFGVAIYERGFWIAGAE